jgi:hypothetical protein
VSVSKPFTGKYGPDPIYFDRKTLKTSTAQYGGDNLFLRLEDDEIVEKKIT